MAGIVVIALAAAAVLLFYQQANAAADSATADSGTGTDDQGDTTPPPSFVQHLGDELSLSDITNDPASWPTGDKIWDVARAIAMAEGYNVPGAVPFVLNNPGDISDGKDTYGAQFHSGSNVTHFPDPHTGWTWLYNKLSNAAQGRSHVYSPDMTWTQFAQKWAGDWQNWLNNVTRALGVDPESTFGEYMNS